VESTSKMFSLVKSGLLRVKHQCLLGVRETVVLAFLWAGSKGKSALDAFLLRLGDFFFGAGGGTSKVVNFISTVESSEEASTDEES